MRSSSQPGAGAADPAGADPAGADPAVAATVRLLHRRQGWGRVAITCLVAYLLGAGSSASATSQGTPPPSWFTDITLVAGALTVLAVALAVVDTMLLRRKPPAVRAQAVPLAKHHPRRPHPHHYPPRHRLTWAVAWVGMLVIVLVGVFSVAGVVDGVAYLAGAGKTVTFDPVSYQTDCQYRSGCQTSTEGILETGGAGTQATWPDVVPLGKPFDVRAPVWGFGLGGSLISSDRIAVVAVLVCLLIEGFAALVVVLAVKLSGNWLRHRRQRAVPVPAAVP
jgi:hypothetical protein